jgi:ArsR family metal-binding transcriptional regulator
MCFITLLGKKAEDLPEQQLSVEEKIWEAILYGDDVPAPVYRAAVKHVEHYEPLPGTPCKGITQVAIDLAINYL